MFEPLILFSISIWFRLCFVCHLFRRQELFDDYFKTFSYQYLVAYEFFIAFKLIHEIFSLWRIYAYFTLNQLYSVLRSIASKVVWSNLSNQFFIIPSCLCIFDFFFDLFCWRFNIFPVFNLPNDRRRKKKLYKFSEWHDWIEIQINRNVTVAKLNQIVQLKGN